MDIYVEGSAMLHDRTGVGQYTTRIVEALQDVAPEHRCSIFVPLVRRGRFVAPIPRSARLDYRFVRPVPIRAYNRLLEYGLAPPIDLLMRAHPDVVYFPNFVRWPVRRGVPTVVTVYDVSFLRCPEFVDERTRRFLTRAVPQSLEMASHVVTVSAHAKQELVEHYEVPTDRISVIPPGIDDRVFYPRPGDQIATLRRKYGLPPRYVLHVGTLEPRKNILGIIDAYETLPPDVRAAHALVLVGAKGWRDEAIVARLGQLGGLRVHVTGYVPDGDLPGLYSGASAFVYPSFYEGFGMPVLEAMACGTPVITSDTSALPEVAGDAAFLVDPTRPNQLSAALLRALTDPDVAQRLKGRGMERARSFRWSDSARILCGVLESVRVGGGLSL